MPEAATATTSAGWVPRLLVSTYAGAIADRFERTRVMFSSALAAFGAMAVVTVLVAADAPILLILLLSAVTSACATFNSPAARAVVPEIVSEKDLATANALFGLVENLVVVVGPAIGGLLLLTGEPTTAMAFNALTFLFSAALVTGLRVRSRGDAGAQGSPCSRRSRPASPLCVPSRWRWRSSCSVRWTAPSTARAPCCTCR